MGEDKILLPVPCALQTLDNFVWQRDEVTFCIHGEIRLFTVYDLYRENPVKMHAIILTQQDNTKK
jgi:hypothetical protein